MAPVELDRSALKSSVAFTGRLACMTRAEAFEVVRQHGGTPSNAVTKRTKLLIVGELGWPLLDDGRPSNKLARASSYNVPVVSERRFLEWTGKSVPDNATKAYSVEQLAALSGLSGEKIQELAQLSLLDERAGRFDFRDLASARQIAKLLADGVRLSEIIRSVKEIRKWLPDVGLGSVRLRPGPCDSLEVEQAGGRTDRRGQFVLAVDDCRYNPDDVFGSAQAAEQAGDIAEAERLLIGGPDDNNSAGAAWIFTRSDDWDEQGYKLVGDGALNASSQGGSVALSADGNTAVVGGRTDNKGIGAAWIFRRSGGAWSQEGPKLVGTDYVPGSAFGIWEACWLRRGRPHNWPFGCPVE
jgi:hypothetical protein